MSSSVGMMTFPTEWKVIKFYGSSHHQQDSNPHELVRYIYTYIYIYIYIYNYTYNHINQMM